MTVLSDTRHLVLLETSGNQDYIFSTNRLRENVGASELTWRAGTGFVLEAVAATGGPTLWDDDFLKMRGNIAKGIEENGIQVIIATSGKAEILVPDRETGKRIIAHATSTALQYAPGLDLCGVISDVFPWNGGQANKSHIAKAIAQAHRHFVEIHGQLPAPAARFPTLPVCHSCDTSGLPAHTIMEREETRSRAGLAKNEAAPKWRERLNKLMPSDEQGKKYWEIPGDLNNLEEEFPDTDWIAIIHADGNGLGKIFLDFHTFIDGNTASDYVSALRCFSLELEAATEAAFVQALVTLHQEKRKLDQEKRHWYWHLPILPLVLGGDDLTVLCDGRSALPFTQAFLRAFVEQTKIAPTISRIAKIPLGKPWLSICAGVAITKPHFPFHAGYELAEQLLRTAKHVKREDPGCSAMDFHILRDSVVSDLVSIRDRLLVDEGKTCLTAKPYVVDGGKESHNVWVQAHDITPLHDRMKILQLRNQDGRPCLSRNQLHELRAGASHGATEADSRMKLIRHRYQEIDSLLEPGGSLFRDAGNDKKETRFLDALEISEFWSGEKESLDGHIDTIPQEENRGRNQIR
ncbi:MAG: hypothetical protein HQL80_03245 [Magnetococcales bacterium]|nr:hypothetical protein [Magnetococcales bacterium]